PPPGNGGNTKHPSGAILGPDGKVVDATNIPLASPKDKTFFWSGYTDGAGGEDLAKKYAQQNGGETLESTLEKKKLYKKPQDSPDNKMPEWGKPGAEKVWTDVSQNFAAGASGKVYVVLGENRRKANVWDNEELPKLQKNPN